MPTERFACLAAGVGLALAVLSLGAHAPIVAPWDKGVHFAAYAAITALLWLGTEGRAPLAVPLAVALLGGVDELRQMFVPGRSAELADFIADALAAASVAAAFLAWGKRACVESSQR
jgi:VanZ family protein